MKTKLSGSGILVIALTTSIVPIYGLVSYNVGRAIGKKEANLALWETPPDMAYCVVYPDGGKKCTEKPVLPKIDVVECIRQCRISTRMEKVK